MEFLLVFLSSLKISSSVAGKRSSASLLRLNVNKTTQAYIYCSQICAITSVNRSFLASKELDLPIGKGSPLRYAPLLSRMIDFHLFFFFSSSGGLVKNIAKAHHTSTFNFVSRANLAHTSCCNIRAGSCCPWRLGTLTRPDPR